MSLPDFVNLEDFSIACLQMYPYLGRDDQYLSDANVVDVGDIVG